MADKCTAQLPAMRVSERLETALMRLAAQDDRALSDYIRRILDRHCFGHAANGADDGDPCLQCNAAQCDARKKRPRE